MITQSIVSICGAAICCWAARTIIPDPKVAQIVQVVIGVGAALSVLHAFTGQ